MVTRVPTAPIEARTTEAIRGVGPLHAWPVALLFLASVVALGTAGSFLAATYSNPGLLVALMLLTVPGILLGSYVPVKLTIGNDGVRVSWLGMGRFVEYGALESVAVDFGLQCTFLVFRPRGKWRVAVPMVERSWIWDEDGSEVADVKKRIDELAAAVRSREPGVRTKSLRASHTAGYREPAARAVDLVACIRDPAEPAAVREAAAKALVAVDGADRQELREVAGATANLKLLELLRRWV